ncbi:MAG: HlyD family efflux transporter periplasmic adaptor subunit [Planctomycetota bacterium]
MKIPPRSPRRRSVRPHRGGVALGILTVLALLGALALINYQSLFGRLSPGAAGIGLAIYHDVERGDFELAITERGEIESAGNTEVRSGVKTKNQPGLAILRIVPEGALVEEGDFLVELDSSALQEERVLQQIAVNTIGAMVVEARNLYETALIARREYLEGTFVQERETLESELFVAEENQSRAIEYLAYSKKLAAKGYVNELQLPADTFAVDKARKEADAARTKLRVLEEFTKAKMLKQLESDILIAKAKWEGQKNSHRLEIGKLAEIDDQLKLCVITSPRSGVVKYAHQRDRRGNNDFVVEEGALIRERQVILTLPELTRMRVEMNVNEALVQHIQPGMPAVVSPIGADGVLLAGEVEKVNQYAEPSGWRKANVKEYKALVRINDQTSDLRSGMTASVTIRSVFLPGVIMTPVQSIYDHAGEDYCFVQSAGGALEARPVRCGVSNDSFVVVESGLEVADRVAVNPRALVDLVSLPDPPADSEPAAPSPVGPPAEPSIAARGLFGASRKGG